MMLQRKLHALDKEDIYFAQFSKNITSQCGEDGILEELFRLLPLSEPYPFCVDIGAWDGKHLSNTYTLLREKNWGGLLVEANNDRCAEAQRLYEDNTKVTCLSSLVALTGENALSGILAKQNVKEDFDFLCIDVDGADYHLWKSITQPVTSSSVSIDSATSNCICFRPKVVCIEFNPSIPHDVFFVQVPDTTVHQGSSLLAMQELGHELGYVLIAVTAFNGIFLRSDLMSFMPAGVQFPQDLYRIHVPHMTTAMFQTYDGELKYVGVKKLLWHNLALNPQTLQILPIKQRVYPFAPPLPSEHAKKPNKKISLQQSMQQVTTIWTKDSIMNHPISSLADFSTLCSVAQQLTATQPIIAEKLFAFVQDKMPDLTMLFPNETGNSRMEFCRCAQEILQYMECILLLVDKLQTQNVHVYVDYFVSPFVSLFSSLDAILSFAAGLLCVRRHDTNVGESDCGMEDVFCNVIYLRCAVEQKYLQALWRNCAHTSDNASNSVIDEELDSRQQIIRRKSQLITPRVKVLAQFAQMLNLLLAGKGDHCSAENDKIAALTVWISDWEKKLAHLKL